MKNTYLYQVFIVGMAIFSMFFGGGNLTFPLWVGSETTSVALSSLGFILTGVLLPFFGILVSIRYNGDYEAYLGMWGKRVGQCLVFALLLFWIPFGSGPRCNHLAFGAFSTQTSWEIPFWVYSLIYSVVVYVLTVRESRVIQILGNVMTPLLVFALFFLIYAGITFEGSSTFIRNAPQENFTSAFFAGYHTMDFIAAIFFSSTVVRLVKAEQKEKFNIKLVRDACLFAVALLSGIYIGLINLGYVGADHLLNIPKDRLLAAIGQSLFADQFHWVIFLVITLSVLSTSIALSLVFSEYLRKTLFRDRLSHPFCLFITVVLSFLLSIIGLEKLFALISYAMTVLYPILLGITVYAYFKRSNPESLCPTGQKEEPQTLFETQQQGSGG